MWKVDDWRGPTTMRSALYQMWHQVKVWEKMGGRANQLAFSLKRWRAALFSLLSNSQNDLRLWVIWVIEPCTHNLHLLPLPTFFKWKKKINKKERGMKTRVKYRQFLSMKRLFFFPALGWVICLFCEWRGGVSEMCSGFTSQQCKGRAESSGKYNLQLFHKGLTTGQYSSILMKMHQNAPKLKLAG